MTDKSDRRLYDAARKLADCWDANIGPPPKKAWYDGHQAMEMALVRFGRFVNSVEQDGIGRQVHRAGKIPAGLPRQRQRVRPGTKIQRTWASKLFLLVPASSTL